MVDGFLPYGRQCIEDDDIAAVAAALRGDYLTTGPTVDSFETAFAEAVEAPHAIACANGTAALHLAMLALDLQPRDALVAPSITFLATANAARYVGAEAVFADVDPDTGLMTGETLANAIARARADGLRPRVVAPVHLGGHAVNMEEIAAIAEREGLAVVEDACHAVGSRIRTPDAWKPVGACDRADMAVFSFHPVKTIACGEGGMITTADTATARRLKLLRSHGMVRDVAAMHNSELSLDGNGAANPWSYEMQDLGFNYRLSDIHCALGLSQLKKLERFVARRREIAARYDDALKSCANWLRPIAAPAWSRTAPHLYVALIDWDAIGVSRADAMRQLHAQGIGTQVHYIPVHRQPYYVGRYGAQHLPGAERYYQRCLSLPLYPDLSDDDVARVAAAIEALPSAAGRSAA